MTPRHRNVSAALLRLPPPPTAFLLRQQIQFYLSPHNLRTDRFLTGEIAKSPERWVQLKVIATFNLMKALLPEARTHIQTLKPSDHLDLHSS